MEFAFMEEAVSDICDSLENDPNRWTIGTHTLTDNKTGILYWISGTYGTTGAITETWNGSSKNTVFSYEQGKRIRASFDIMRRTKANQAQLKVLRATRKNITDVKFKEIGERKPWFEKFVDWLKS